MKSAPSGDMFGFRFWLGWILGFVLSLSAASGFWTISFLRLFGDIRGGELVFSWMIAVFGSWLLLVTPFMRKKERIWKRLNNDQEKAVDAWLLCMGIFVGLLVASCLFWSWRYRAEIPSAGLSGRWAKAVFGTWLLLALPLLAVMYRMADRILKDAIRRQTETRPKFRSIFVEKSRRLLPEELKRTLEKTPPTLRGAHVASLVFPGGTRSPQVFIVGHSEVLGIYDCQAMDFEPGKAVAVEVVSSRELPLYEEERWLRLDGRV